jgi:geranylgeranyl reductase family protein
VRRVDAVVVGAGPAGAAAAATLARAGRDVVVVDRARFPRDKCCGDGLTALALRELEALGLDPDAVPSWTRVAEAVVRSPGGREVVYPLPPGPGSHSVVARRAELDAALVQLARDAGAEVHEGCGLLDATETDDGVRLTVDGIGEISAAWAVGADGMWSPLRKALDAATPGYLGEWHAFRQYFRGASTEDARRLWVWFDADLLPGYAWSFPVGDGVVNVGFGLLRGAGTPIRDMKRLWPDLLDRPHVRRVLGPTAEPEDPHKAWPIPARVDGVLLTTRRALFVGDAAAATDPMTGEGIGQALETGRLAAEAIIAGGGAAAVRDGYTHAVRRALVPDHRLARRLGAVLARRSLAEAAIRVTGSTGWTRRNFGRWLFEDYPRALVLTPGRWHRGMFHSPGAYPDR